MANVVDLLAPKASPWNGYALVIAISQYQTVKPLPLAVQNDAKDIRSTLTSPSHCGYDPANVRFLLDADATLAEIRAGLSWLANVAGPDDSVVVYFSGHGARLQNSGGYESLLIPVDADNKDLGASSLSETELSTALKSIRSARLLILIDACHSGGAVVLKGDAGSQSVDSGFGEKSLQHLAEGHGRVAISSSRSTEYSLVMPAARNSVFTQHLLEVLKGETASEGDGFIRVFRVFEHVAASVPVTTSKRQHPIFKASDVETNFPVALEKGGSKAAGQVGARMITPEFDWEEFGRILPELYPLGPLDQEVWTRAGGDVSRLKLQQSGRTTWFSSLATLRQGGGGQLTKERLLETALSDFPNHQGLRTLLDRSL
jgi:hypothetical protein